MSDISVTEDRFSDFGATVISLRIPHVEMVATKSHFWLKVKISWWLLKMPWVRLKELRK